MGVFQSVENAVERMVEVKDRIVPSEEHKEVYREGYLMYNQLFADLAGCFDKTR